jgi:hypothetical protein
MNTSPAKLVVLTPYTASIDPGCEQGLAALERRTKKRCTDECQDIFAVNGDDGKVSSRSDGGMSVRRLSEPCRARVRCGPVG